MSHLPGKFVWFEHLSGDTAPEFYRALLGWRVEAIPMNDHDYPMIHSAGQGIGGAQKVVVPPTDIPKIGRFSVVLDPLGVAFALMKPTWAASVLG